jgi:hypothetical protein
METGLYVDRQMRPYHHECSQRYGVMEQSIDQDYHITVIRWWGSTIHAGGSLALVLLPFGVAFVVVTGSGPRRHCCVTRFLS